MKNKIFLNIPKQQIKHHFNITSSSFTSRPTRNIFLMSSNNFFEQNKSLFPSLNIEKEKILNKTKENLGLNIQCPIHYTSTEPSISIPNQKYIKPELGSIKRKNSLIPFTKIKSPFSNEGREINLYKKIFYFFTDRRKKYVRDIKLIQNKLNIDYAESEEAYEQKLIKHNLELIKKGEKIKHFSGPTFSEVQLKDLQKKVKFMKSVVDYSYPDMVLFKVKQSEKLLKIKNKENKILEPFKLKDLNLKKKEKLMKDYLNDAIHITKVEY